MSGLTIDQLTAELLRSGAVPPRAVLDGSLSVVDISSRNRNYRASWSNGAGVVLKQPDPLDPTSAVTLENEVSFYDACARVANDPSDLPIPTRLPGFPGPTTLALELVREGEPLWKFRKAPDDRAAAYAALGRALATFHRFGSSPSFRADPYVQQLTSAKPWGLAIHKPSVRSLHRLSGVQVAFFRMLQRETDVGPHLDSLSARLEPTTVIHADLKADNILVASKPEMRVTLLDWELAQLGDPAWDVGAVLQDLLASWLEVLAPSRDQDIAQLVAHAAHPLRELQPTFRSFLAAYVAATELEPTPRDELLERAVECSAAMFVQRAIEFTQQTEHLPNHSIMMLQVAANIFAAPAKASLFLYGTPLASRRRRTSAP